MPWYKKCKKGTCWSYNWEGTCHIRGERSEMSSNYHDEAGPSFSRLSYEYEWRNECRALSFTANPKKFLNADTFCFVEPRACGPPLSGGSIGWICQVKVNALVVKGQQGWCIAYLSFSLGSQNEHACYLLYWTFDQAFYPCRIGTNHHCIALEQLSGCRPATSVHRYRFILRTWSSLTTLRGLVRSLISPKGLFGKTELDKEKRVLDRNNGQQRP